MPLAPTAARDAFEPLDRNANQALPRGRLGRSGSVEAERVGPTRTGGFGGRSQCWRWCFAQHSSASATCAAISSATAPRPIAARGRPHRRRKHATRLLRKRPRPSPPSIRRGAELLQSGSAGTGSGVRGRAGHIVTNNHVVAGAEEIGVLLGGEQAVPAELLGPAPWADPAALRLSVFPDDFRPILVGCPPTSRSGRAYAIGNPLDCRAASRRA